MELNQIFAEDCMATMNKMADCSVDSIVTDPPAGISFMGKEWDGDKGGRDHWIAWMQQIASECYRVLKPGAHALVWSLPRTSHWTATAWENAGFEVRDRIAHCFGSGFPKSLDISKAIDKQAGVEREVLTTLPAGSGPLKTGHVNVSGGGLSIGTDRSPEINITVPATPEAKQWEGWGTALKPAIEDWWLLRKPISEKTVAENVLKHGTGGINIDGCRVSVDPTVDDMLRTVARGKRESETWENGSGFKNEKNHLTGVPSNGRFPANLIHDGSDEVVALFPDSSVTGVRKKPHIKTEAKNTPFTMGNPLAEYPNDKGSAARFFYCAKPSPAERNMGCEDIEAKVKDAEYRQPTGNAMVDRIHGCGTPKKNNHPTVKPLALMQYLVKLITPPGGICYDPFSGSGTTLMACKSLGINFIASEMTPEYVEIAKARVAAIRKEVQEQLSLNL